MELTTPRPMEVKLTPTLSAWFLTQLYKVSIKTSEFTYCAILPTYIRRIDEEALFTLEDCGGLPVEFHACLTVMGRLCLHCTARNQVYEGEADVAIHPRDVIRYTATSFNVDPNEMMAWWPKARSYLLHKRYQIPETAEEIVQHQQLHGNANVRNLH